MKKPNFFIIGAPKCGTTSLASWLGQHPEIYFSPAKEPHFFNTDGLMSTQTLPEYEALFEDAGSQHKAVGEGSTHYLYSREAVQNIREYAPEARFIVCLRNPVEMAPALHAERLSWGRESTSDFEKAWRLQTKRAAGKNVPKTLAADPERLQYSAYCKLGEQLGRLYETVEAEQIHCVLLDDMRDSPEGTYNSLLEFLGVGCVSGIEFKRSNPAHHTASPLLAQATRRLITLKNHLGISHSFGVAARLRQLNVKRQNRRPLHKAFQQELKEHFRSDIHELEQYLGRDLSAWFT